MSLQKPSALLLTVLFSCGFAVSQSNQTDPLPNSTPAGQQSSSVVHEPASVIKATTRLVVVDVIATDAKGKPVNDLSSADFKLLENGKEQKISTFTPHLPTANSDQNSQLSATAISPQTLPENVFTNVPQYQTDAPLNIILLDALNTPLQDQAWMRSRMIALLDKLPVDHPIAIYTMGSRLRLLQDFTTDPTALKAAISSLKDKSSTIVRNDMGGAEEILPVSVYDYLKVNAAMMLEGILRFEAEDTVHESDFQMQYTIDVFRTLAANLAAYPGRKNLIWVSEGFPIDLSAGDPTNERRQGGPVSYASDIARISYALETAQVSVYPVYAGGLETSPILSAGVNGNQKVIKPSNVNANYATMHEIADRTGGLFFRNNNDVDLAIKESLDDGSSYYALGYYPENKKWTGDFRKFKISSRPGIKLRYRSGYVAVDPTAFQTESEKLRAREFSRFLDLNFPVSTGLLFHAAVLPPSEKNTRVQVNFLIDPNALHFETLGDGTTQQAKIECAVEAYSANGKAINTVGHTIDTPLSSNVVARIMKSGFPCQQSIDLPPGSYVLRLGVRDNQTGQIGTTNAKLSFTQSAASQSKKKDAQKDQLN